MGMMLFSFAIVFGVLSGWVGAVVVTGYRGWGALVLGLLASAAAMGVFMVVQVGLLNFLGGSKRLDEVLVTGAVLVAALSFVWGPAFGVFYWRQGKMGVRE